MSSTPIRYTTVPKELPGDEPDDVLFNSLYGVRTVELNRPKKLNSLNGSMARKILPRLREWEKSEMANAILISGAGPKAFCAGGDVAELATQNATPEGQKKVVRLLRPRIPARPPYCNIQQAIRSHHGRHHHGRRSRPLGPRTIPNRNRKDRLRNARNHNRLLPRRRRQLFPPPPRRRDRHLPLPHLRTPTRRPSLLRRHSNTLHRLLRPRPANHTPFSELVFKDYATLPERLDLLNSTISEFTSNLPFSKHGESPKPATSQASSAPPSTTTSATTASRK